jgi:hypothetical protein
VVGDFDPAAIEEAIAARFGEMVARAWRFDKKNSVASVPRPGGGVTYRVAGFVRMDLL